MPTSHEPEGRQRGDREKRLVALSSVIAAVLLTSTKLVVGWSTGSLGIMSEAAHSGLDLLAAAVTFWAVRISGRPADSDHPYGHGKFESLAALFETALLLATCVWIVYEAAERLFFRPVAVEATAWSFGVIALSIVVDVSRSRALARVARKYQSDALEADALHFSTDVWSSAVVLFGLGCVFVAGRFGLPWLAKADSVAALAVAAIVVWVSVQLGRKSLDALVDALPAGIRERVERVARVPDVVDIAKLRLRRSGPEIFVDITLLVGREHALERAHAIASEAEEAIRAELPGADVVVHVEPKAGEDEAFITKIRVLAARHALGAHGIRFQDQDGRRSVQMHLEIDEALSLRTAHRRVTAFEKALRSEIGNLSEIVTHIEPAGDASAQCEAEQEDALPLKLALAALVEEGVLPSPPHDLRVLRVTGELSVSFHCALQAETSIADAHGMSERMEKVLRMRVPDLGRVVIHVEPPEGDEA